MKIINVDLDGVVYPWHEVMALWCWQLMGNTTWDHGWEWDHHNEMPLPPPTKWNFADLWGMTEEELHSAARIGVERDFVWSVGKPINGSVMALWQLSEAGFYIRLVTQRLVHKNSHAIVQEKTAKWLDLWNVPYHEILYIGKSDKASFAADYAIDDNPDVVQGYLDRSSTEAYLFERPWNKGLDLPSVFAWSEFAAIVAEVEADV